MARYKVILAYDGTNFLGFQRQIKGRTVQGAVEQALKNIGWQEGKLLVAGRTDRGVHARGQVIAFDMDWKHSPCKLQRALNAKLPYDVVARDLRISNPDFQPRFDALSRKYQYHLFCDGIRQPLKERYAWRVWPGVQLLDMKRATKHLVGTHDFAAFGKASKDGGPTIRSVTKAEWITRGDGLVFEIQANSFLYHMVRRLVALFVQIGQGKVVPEEVRNYLRGWDSTSFQELAPPQGLMLYEVIYPS